MLRSRKSYLFHLAVSLFFVLFCTSFRLIQGESGYYYTNNGNVFFKSEAQQEFIKASSDLLRGLFDPEKNTFVFKVIIRTFEGFNSELQREHFNEKYLESEKFPEAIFLGKIIENVNLREPGQYQVRAKGKLMIHGIEQERIIKCDVRTENNLLKVTSKFNITLADHNIKIPKVVHEKIANEITVEINIELKQKSN